MTNLKLLTIELPFIKVIHLTYGTEYKIGSLTVFVAKHLKRELYWRDGVINLWGMMLLRWDGKSALS